MPTITTENCFTTIAEADVILDNFHSGGSWTSITDDEKARLLITATMMLQMAYGFALTEVEATALAAAVSFQALYLSQNANMIDNVMAASIGGVTSETLGSMSRTRNKGGFDIMDAISPYAKHTLVPSGTIELMRG